MQPQKDIKAYWDYSGSELATQERCETTESVFMYVSFGGLICRRSRHGENPKDESDDEELEQDDLGQVQLDLMHEDQHQQPQPHVSEQKVVVPPTIDLDNFFGKLEEEEARAKRAASDSLNSTSTTSVYISTVSDVSKSDIPPSILAASLSDTTGATSTMFSTTSATISTESR